MTFRLATALGLVAALAGPLNAQARIVDLTGSPVERLTEPFTAISHGVELGDGRFLFVDRAEVAVRLASFTTRQVTTLGRQGAGPNEYRAPTGPVADGKGGAIIADGSLGRVLKISAAGELVGTGLTREELGGLSPTMIRGITPTGELLLSGRLPAGSRDSLPLQRLNPATGQATTIAWWPMIRTVLGPAVRTPDGGTARSIGTAQMWPARTEWVGLPDGSVALIRPIPFRVDVISPTGSVLRGGEVRYQPIRVDRAFKEMIRAERGPVPDDQFPEHLPPFEGREDVLVTPEGETWVRRMRGANDPVPSYDIFDRTGTRTAGVRLRPHSKVVGFGDGVVYVAREDPDDGFWYLERYRRP